MELLAKKVYYSSLKRAETRNYKKFLKKNLPKLRNGCQMEALADKVHRQREHIPQHCYISHNHSYISSSEYLCISGRSPGGIR